MSDRNTFDESLYRQLLAEIGPRVIESDEELERAITALKALTFCKAPEEGFWRSQSPEERAVSSLLTRLITMYEGEKYPIASKPHEILQHIMEASGTTTESLIGIIGSTNEEVLKVLSGEVGITEELANRLGTVFSINPALFM